MAVGLEATGAARWTARCSRSPSACPTRQKASASPGEAAAAGWPRARCFPPSPGAGPKRGFAVPLADLFAGPWRGPATGVPPGHADSDLIDGPRAARPAGPDPVGGSRRLGPRRAGRLGGAPVRRPGGQTSMSAAAPQPACVRQDLAGRLPVPALRRAAGMLGRSDKLELYSECGATIPLPGARLGCFARGSGPAGGPARPGGGDEAPDRRELRLRMGGVRRAARGMAAELRRLHAAPRAALLRRHRPVSTSARAPAATPRRPPGSAPASWRWTWAIRSTSLAATSPTGSITVQADAEALPFAPESFDFVMSIGVLHHLPDTDGRSERWSRCVRPGRAPARLPLLAARAPEPSRLLLRVVFARAGSTTRLPHRLLHAACYPLAARSRGDIVLAVPGTRRFPGLRRVADALPLKAYADYPFGVLVNDQFDRFSAPIERRFTRDEAGRLMRDAGLVDVVVLPNNGWVCDGRRPPVTARGSRALSSRPRPESQRPSAVAAQSPSTPGLPDPGTADARRASPVRHRGAACSCSSTRTGATLSRAASALARSRIVLAARRRDRAPAGAGR